MYETLCGTENQGVVEFQQTAYSFEIDHTSMIQFVTVPVHRVGGSDGVVTIQVSTYSCYSLVSLERPIDAPRLSAAECKTVYPYVGLPGADFVPIRQVDSPPLSVSSYLWCCFVYWFSWCCEYVWLLFCCYDGLCALLFVYFGSGFVPLKCQEWHASPAKKFTMCVRPC